MFTLGSAATSWQGQSLCRSYPGIDFVPDDDGDSAPALAVCAKCPVVSQCLAWALETASWDGVFGGTTGQQRRALAGIGQTDDAGKMRPRGNSLSAKITGLLELEAVVDRDGRAIGALARRLGAPAINVERQVHRLREGGLIQIMVDQASHRHGAVAIWLNETGAPRPQWAIATPSRRAVIPQPIINVSLTDRILERLARASVGTNFNAIDLLAYELGVPRRQVASRLSSLRKAGRVDWSRHGRREVCDIWILPAGRRLVTKPAATPAPAAVASAA